MHDGYETPWNSAKAAKYPDLLNKLLADEIIKAVEAKPTPSPVILPRTDDCQEPNFKPFSPKPSGGRTQPEGKRKRRRNNLPTRSQLEAYETPHGV